MSTTTLAQGSNPGLTAPISTFYDAVFLERAMIELRHDFGATVKNVPLQAGKTVSWTRFTPLAISTTALSEAANPTAVDMTATSVTATLAHYGGYTQVGELYSLVSVEDGLKDHVSVYGQLAGEVIDTLIRNELHTGGTFQTTAGGLGATATAITNIHTTDTLTGLEIRRSVRTLRNNKARTFPGAMFRAVTGPYTAMDLYGNSEWLDAHRYTTSDAIERGVIGKLHGVEFVLTNNQYYTLTGGFSTSATNIANVYETYVFGAGAYGTVNLGNTTSPKVYVKNPGGNSTDNPIDQFSTVGWKMPFAVKTLNSNWIVRIATGATDGYDVS